MNIAGRKRIDSPFGAEIIASDPSLYSKYERFYSRNDARFKLANIRVKNAYFPIPNESRLILTKSK